VLQFYERNVLSLLAVLHALCSGQGLSVPNCLPLLNLH
jgi:hypothetical protein